MLPRLTDREHDILDLLARGQSNANSAARLASATDGPKHVANILAKLSAPAREREPGLGRHSKLGRA